MRRFSKHISRPEWWVAIFTGLLALTTAGAVWYARGQIQALKIESANQRKQDHEEAQIQHLLVLVREFDEEPLATYRKTLAFKRLNPKEGDPPELYRILDFFETVGRLSERGYLNDEDVWNQFGYWILNLNADSEMRDNVEATHNEDPNTYAVYLNLVERLKRIEAAHGGKLLRLKPEEVKAFYLEESKIATGTPMPQGRTVHSAK